MAQLVVVYSIGRSSVFADTLMAVVPLRSGVVEIWSRLELRGNCDILFQRPGWRIAQTFCLIHYYCYPAYALSEPEERQREEVSLARLGRDQTGQSARNATG
jgi:hypothetical protein